MSASSSEEKVCVLASVKPVKLMSSPRTGHPGAKAAPESAAHSMAASLTVTVSFVSPVNAQLERSSLLSV